MTRGRWFAVIVAVTVVTGFWVLLPPASQRLPLPPDPLTARGAIHVHTVHSDGAGTPEQIAASAHRAGLDFVVLTDHGDATRAPDPPRYVDGVLLIDAVEISTTAGHLVALGLPQAPYRLAGDARDVLEDVHRLGGIGIAAHPDSPKPELQWRDWKAAIDGLEWLNVDSEWRDESRMTLTRALLRYWFRPSETLASLFDRPIRTLDRWDTLIVTRPIVAVAGHDAHARIPLSGQADVDQGRSLGLPSYEAAFRALSQGVVLSAPLGGTAESAARDAAAVLGAIRAGATYTVVDGLAGPAALDFHAVVEGAHMRMGESTTGGRPIQLFATLKPTLPASAIVLLQNGAEIARTENGAPLMAIRSADAGPTAYRVEVRLAGAPGTPPVPWIVSNPIYVGLSASRLSTRPPPAARSFNAPPLTMSVGEWRIERAATSEGRVDGAVDRYGQPALHFSWHLADGTPSGQYAALVAPIHGAGHDNDFALTASSAAPMRISVQIRIPEGAGLRWRRSIYLDQTPRDFCIRLQDMTAIEAAPNTALDISRADTVLFVVDTVNAAPDSAGELWLNDVRWGCGAAADIQGLALRPGR